MAAATSSPSRGAITVAIYDARGARVATLLRGERTAEAYTVEWNGRDDRGGVVTSGVCFAWFEHTSGTRPKNAPQIAGSGAGTGSPVTESSSDSMAGLIPD